MNIKFHFSFRRESNRTRRPAPPIPEPPPPLPARNSNSGPSIVEVESPHRNTPASSSQYAGENLFARLVRHVWRKNSRSDGISSPVQSRSATPHHMASSNTDNGRAVQAAFVSPTRSDDIDETDVIDTEPLIESRS